jgi:hypothetical protein
MSMQSDPQPQELETQDPAERREAPRADVAGRYSMRLDPGGGREALNCTVMDFSITGVRLELPEDVPLPKKVQILIGGLVHNGRVAWRKEKLIGVDFIDEHHSIF